MICLRALYYSYCILIHHNCDSSYSVYGKSTRKILTSSIGQTGRPCPVMCNFMEERENAVTLRCRDGHLKWE